MKKQTLTIFLIFVGLAYLSGQSLRSYVITTNGTALMHNEGSFYLSIGEAMNTEIDNGENQIAQGFLQVTVLGKTVSIEERIDFELNVFPNPVSQYLQIELEEQPGQDVKYFLLDISGRLVSSSEIENMVTEVDFKNVESGTYFLQLVSPEKKSQVVKIQKIKS